MQPRDDGQRRSQRGHPSSERRPHPVPAFLSGYANGLAWSARLRKDTVNAHGLGDVLDLLLAEIFVGYGDLGFQMVVHRSRDENPAGVGQTFQSGRNIHAIAVDIAAIDDDVAEVDADAEHDAAILRHPGVALRHAPLHLDGALDRIDDAGELDQEAIAHGLDNAPFVPGNCRGDELLAVGYQLRKRAGLIRLHETAVADHVSGQDRGQTAFHLRSPLGRETIELPRENLCGERMLESRLLASPGSLGPSRMTTAFLR